MSEIGELLPKIVKLVVAFADGHDLGPKVLLGAVKTARNWRMTLSSTIRGQVKPIHPSFFSVMRSLLGLEHLSLHLDPNVRLNCLDLHAIVSHRASMYLTNSMLLHDYPQIPAKIMLTRHDLRTTPPTLGFLQLLEELEIAAWAHRRHEYLSLPGTPTVIYIPPPLTHSDFLQCMSTLPALRALTMYLSSITPLTVPTLSSMVSHQKMKFFDISSPQGNQFIPKPLQMSLTADDILRAPIDLKFLQALDLVHIQSPIVVTYGEAVQITEKINQVSPSYMVLFELSIDEEVSFGWPLVRDYEAVLEDTTPELGLQGKSESLCAGSRGMAATRPKDPCQQAWKGNSSGRFGFSWTVQPHRLN